MDVVKKTASDTVYGPGMGLESIQEVKARPDEFDDEGMEVEEVVPLRIGHKRPSYLSSVVPLKKSKVDPVISSSVMRPYTGGKGLQRVRAKQVLKG